MSEHLDEAKMVARYAENVASSPDERSVPYLLGGILHALIAIAENTTPADLAHDTGQGGEAS